MSLLDKMMKQTEARIAEIQAQQMKYLLEPRVFVHPVKDPPVEMRIGTIFRYLGPPPMVYGLFDDGPVAKPPTDPLDVKYDGVTLRDLLVGDRWRRQEAHGVERHHFTPAQRAAISAHWSAELRAKVAAAKDRERRRVVVDLEEP